MVVWNAGARRDLTAALRAQPPGRGPRAQHVPAAQRGDPACLPGRQSRRWSRRSITTSSSAQAATSSARREPCHDCAPGHPLPAVRHGCYRGSRAATAPVALSSAIHRTAWRSLVAGYIFISKSQRDLLSGFGFPPDRVFIRHNMIPARDVPPSDRQDTVVYAGRLDAAKGLPVLMRAWDRYQKDAPDHPGLRLVIAGSGPLDRDVAGWAAARPSVQLAGQLDARRLCAGDGRGARGNPALRLGGDLRTRRGRGDGAGGAAGRGRARFFSRASRRRGGRCPLPRGRSRRPGPGPRRTSDSYPDRYAEYGKQARKAYEQRFDPAASMRKTDRDL